MSFIFFFSRSLNFVKSNLHKINWIYEFEPHICDFLQKKMFVRFRNKIWFLCYQISPLSIFYVIIVGSFLFYLLDISIVSAMEQECTYVQNSAGEVVLHPKTGEPLQNCKVTKSDYVIAMETIERVSKQVLSSALDASSSSVSKSTVITDSKTFH